MFDGYSWNEKGRKNSRLEKIKIPLSFLHCSQFICCFPRTYRSHLVRSRHHPWPGWKCSLPAQSCSRWGGGPAVALISVAVELAKHQRVKFSLSFVKRRGRQRSFLFTLCWAFGAYRSTTLCPRQRLLFRSHCSAFPQVALAKLASLLLVLHSKGL